MPCEIDTTAWTGEGDFTQLLAERLSAIDGVRFVKVENAPATRSDADYNFISNECFVAFATVQKRESFKRLGIVPASRSVAVPAMTLADLEAVLTAIPDVGAPDYSDQAMLQYLRSERVVPAYQTRGYKIVELVRIYEAGTPRRS